VLLDVVSAVVNDSQRLEARVEELEAWLAKMSDRAKGPGFTLSVALCSYCGAADIQRDTVEETSAAAAAHARSCASNPLKVELDAHLAALDRIALAAGLCADEGHDTGAILGRIASAEQRGYQRALDEVAGWHEAQAGAWDAAATDDTVPKAARIRSDGRRRAHEDSAAAIRAGRVTPTRRTHGDV